MGKQCPVCEEGNLTNESSLNEVKCRGFITKVECRYQLCDNCGSEQTGSVDASFNKRQVVDFKSSIDDKNLYVNLL